MAYNKQPTSPEWNIASEAATPDMPGLIPRSELSAGVLIHPISRPARS